MKPTQTWKANLKAKLRNRALTLWSLLHKRNELLKPICLFGRVEIHLGTLLLFAIALALRFAQLLLLAYTIALVHELAHIAVARALKVKVQKVELLPFGVTMQLSNQMVKSPQDEIKIALAGPVSNVLFAGVCLALFRFGMLSFELARFFILGNCTIALINLVPALPLDGGRVLRSCLTLRWGYLKAFNTTMKLTHICAVALVVAGVAVVFVTKFNFSLLLISCFLLINAVFEQRGSKLVMMRDILYSRKKLEENRIGHAGLLVMMHDANARSALKLLSYNKYYLIRIIDQAMQPVATITETQLIEGLIEKGMKTKAAQLLE